MTAMQGKAVSSSAPVGFFQALSARTAGLGRWRALCLSFLLGLLAVGALPPLYAVPLLLPAFTGLTWLLDGAGRGWAAFLRAWAFALGFFLAGLYWVTIAFFVEADRFGVVGPFAVLGLSLGLGLFVALTLWISRRYFWGGPQRIAVLAIAWLVAELLRAWLLTGFPWNLIGSVWAFSATTLQPAALIGVWGLSLFTVFAASAPAAIGDRASPRQRFAPAVLAILFLMTSGLYAGIRITGAPDTEDDLVPSVRLRLVQPDIPQESKWDQALRAEHVRQQLRMSRGPGYDTVTHIIWSETAVPFLLDRAEGLQQALSDLAPPGGAVITGAPRGEDADDGSIRFWNSLFAFDGNGRQVSAYDKAHLVPFGEYVPFRSILGATKLTAGRADFNAGPGVSLMEIPGLPPYSALICYEIIFPGAVTPKASAARPQWLLNLTNDNWFGLSSGPYQHLAAARLRAVEEGLPVVRAANGGISASIDSYGRFLGKLPLGRSGVLDVGLARPLQHPTLFSKINHYTSMFLLGFFYLLVLLLRRIL
ncbi:apolipoprotein N-acyltransferase [Limibacillus halophilus]|nr:apolipoprotein N-acyltransferase [Limibacillus halophilus]